MEGFVDVASHLFGFILLFVGDTTEGLEKNASLIAFHIMSRLTLLSVEFFGTRQVDTKELLKSPSGPSDLEHIERAASRILSQTLVRDCAFVLVCSKKSRIFCSISCNLFIRPLTFP